MFVLALAVGALNYVDGGRELGRRFSLSRRLLRRARPRASRSWRSRPTSRAGRRPAATDRRDPAGRRARSSRPSRPRWRCCRVGPARTGSLPGSRRAPADGTVVELVLQRLDPGPRVVADDDAPGFQTSDPDASSPTPRSPSRAAGTPRSSPPRRMAPRSSASGSSSPSTPTGSPRAGPRHRSIRGWSSALLLLVLGHRRSGLRARRRDAAADPPGRLAAGAHRGQRRRDGPRARGARHRRAAVIPRGVLLSVSPVVGGGGGITVGLVVGLQLVIVARRPRRLRLVRSRAPAGLVERCPDRCGPERSGRGRPAPRGRPRPGRDGRHAAVNPDARRRSLRSTAGPSCTRRTAPAAMASTGWAAGSTRTRPSSRRRTCGAVTSTSTPTPTSTPGSRSGLPGGMPAWSRSAVGDRPLGPGQLPPIDRRARAIAGSERGGGSTGAGRDRRRGRPREHPARLARVRPAPRSVAETRPHGASALSRRGGGLRPACLQAAERSA